MRSAASAQACAPVCACCRAASARQPATESAVSQTMPQPIDSWRRRHAAQRNPANRKVDNTVCEQLAAPSSTSVGGVKEILKNTLTEMLNGRIIAKPNNARVRNATEERTITSHCQGKHAQQRRTNKNHFDSSLAFALAETPDRTNRASQTSA